MSILCIFCSQEIQNISGHIIAPFFLIAVRVFDEAFMSRNPHPCYLFHNRGQWTFFYSPWKKLSNQQWELSCLEKNALFIYMLCKESFTIHVINDQNWVHRRNAKNKILEWNMSVVKTAAIINAIDRYLSRGLKYFIKLSIVDMMPDWIQCCISLYSQIHAS